MVTRKQLHTIYDWLFYLFYTSTLYSELMWISLPYEKWKDTLDTLHMWMQIVGKVKLEVMPFVNQWWQVALYVTSRGMTTGRMPYEDRAFEVVFDFIDHTIGIYVSDGKQKFMQLHEQTVADFYRDFMEMLETLGIKVDIYPMPVEFADPIPFAEDIVHKTYEKEWVEKWWRSQLQISFLFDRFRSDFRGKSSPIHFFWGSFDLNGTRFSGKKAKPPKVEGNLQRIMEFAENEENFAFGFWPGDERFPHGAFYSYIYPAPEGFETIKTGPAIAYFNKNLSECILPYESVIKATNPEQIINHFLDTTYWESAKLAGWDIETLRGSTPYES